ncbi:hypothetical protein F5Y10DRAFT_240716 [Nemania abortiva]|nr:hypothetical protein F5Y10DRAFT_240716 [Nemania abortiva]
MEASHQELPTNNAGQALSLVELPRRITAYHKLQLKGLSTIYYCGESEHDRLYAVDIQHLARGGKAPLGARPGLFLHAGPSTDSPIVAAAGDEMLGPYQTYVRKGPNSDVILVGSPKPELPDYGKNTMRARTTDNGMVAFSFRVQEGSRPSEADEIFSWIQVPEGSQPGFEYGGYKLVRHPHQKKPKLEPGMNLLCWMWWPTYNMSNEDEIIATLSYGKPRQLHSVVSLFTIELTSEDFANNIGDAHARSILATAARIFQMKATGRTSHSGLEKAERRRVRVACR